MKNVKSIIIGALLVATLAGCSNAEASEAPSPTTSAAENPYGGFAVDAPSPTEVLLSVSSATETDDYSLTDLRKLATEEVTIEEPFAKAKQTFTGVPLKALFEAAGITDADKVSTLALNDYKFDDLAGNFTKSNGYLAIEREGKVIPMDQGGPIRIIFPTGTKYFTYLDAWNWSLRSISTVK